MLARRLPRRSQDPRSLHHGRRHGGRCTGEGSRRRLRRRARTAHQPHRRPQPARASFARLQPCYDDGGASIYDAVAYGNWILERAHAPGRRVILLVSETRDHGSVGKIAGIVESLNRANTVVDAVAFSPGRDALLEDAKTGDGASGGVIGLVLMAVQALRKNAPKEFARETGGEYINFSNQNGFDRGLNTLANRLHNAYSLSFVPRFPPDNPGAAPGLHDLRVRVPKYPDAVIKAREAYWSTAPQ